jgi:CheY-like chemotaxis protein
VVVLTACEADQAREAYRRGADRFLQKPQPLASVADLLESLLQGVHR